jgi:hypothetical protein
MVQKERFKLQVDDFLQYWNQSTEAQETGG